jgi:2-oxoglutarate dehydrogenase complex dehydrogenase (E1) component-like enzyme
MASKAKRSAKKTSKKSSKKASKRASGGTLIRWTSADDKALKQMVKQKISTKVMGQKLKRTESSVRQHVYKLGLSLR